jgi:hypothetical protein
VPGDPVAFAIDAHRAIAVRSELMWRHAPCMDNARQPGWVEQPTAGRVSLVAAGAAGIL